jgi:hypothetical protein
MTGDREIRQGSARSDGNSRRSYDPQRAGKKGSNGRKRHRKEEVDMLHRVWCRRLLLLAGTVVGVTTPVMAQVLNSAPQSIPFPVLAGAEFKIDPHSQRSDEFFSVADGGLSLRSTALGWVDVHPYCELPERHWGPVSVINCFLEVSGTPTQSGMALPARVSLASLPMGSTITLRFLVQAPLIVLDLQGNPTAVMDTFLEEYHWMLVDGSPPAECSP